jgi:hypothetical protein
MKLRATTAFVLLFALMFSLLLPVNQNQVIAQQNPTQQIQQLTPQQIRRLQARSRTVRLIRRMLLEQNVPFEPYLLFARNWRSRLATHFNQMPAMQVSRSRLSPDLSGVEIANELTLPEQIRLTGDTVILARKVKFQGNNVRIKGPYNLHFFVVDSFRTRDGGGAG